MVRIVLRDAGMLTMIDGQSLPTIVERHDRNSGRRPVEQVRLSVEYILIYLGNTYGPMTSPHTLGGQQPLGRFPMTSEQWCEPRI